MAFQYQLSDELKLTLARLAKRDAALALAVNKKIKQIKENDSTAIDHFKNLRHGLSDCKRVHIGNFVLLFRVYKGQNFIFFYRFTHHDDAYE
jgi:mRNA-degrading endonuclease RelE of RelBE toxin-antitoxin system